MTARNLIAVVAVAVAASALTTLVQLALRSSADASGGTDSALVAINDGVHARVDVRGQILSQLKTMRKKTAASFAAAQASFGGAAGHSASSDTAAASRLVPMQDVATDYHVLVDAAPPGFDVTSQYDGILPRLLKVMHSFCVDAESTDWGNRPSSRPRPTNCG